MAEELVDFTDIGKTLNFGMPVSTAPKFKGAKVYRDPADNLSKIPFNVIVTESYVPNVHWSLLGYEREPDEQYIPAARDITAKVRRLTHINPKPIFDPGLNEVDMPCHAKLTGDFIIDALVTGQKISFEDPDDMNILADWIDQFLKSYKDVDLSRFPDRKAFNDNAKKALQMLRGNLLRKEDWEERVNPRPLTLADIIAHM